MSASFGDWHQLANYGLPSRHSQSDGLLHLSAAATSLAGSENHITLTVQGDGVHVLDVSAQVPRGLKQIDSDVHQVLTQHSISTFTLGPSTSYSAPAVSRIREINAKQVRTTFAAINSAPGLSKEKQGKTIYVWKEEGDSIMSTPSRETIEV